MRTLIAVLLLTIGYAATTIAATDTWDGSLSRPNDIGFGSADNPILINTAEEFAFLMAAYENSNSFCAHKHFRLTTDLDLQSVPWRYGVQSHDTKTWRAHFDGDGHTISNVYIPVYPTTLDVQCGLFARVGGDDEYETVIENLNVDGITIEQVDDNGQPIAGSQHRGTIVGRDYGHSRIERCHTTDRDAAPTTVGQRSDLQLVITDVQPAPGLTFNITAEVRGTLPDAKRDINDEFLYSWYELEPGQTHTTTVGTSRTLTGARAGRTYHLVARHPGKKNIILGAYHTFRSPVYVALHAITETDAARYTLDGTTYPEGNDRNDGSTPEQAVRTLERAYELLTPEADGADAWSNIVVIMGDYDDDVFNTHRDAEQKNANPHWFLKDRPATIVGQYGNIRGGRIQMSTETLVLDADTRFDCIELHGNPAIRGGDGAQLYAQGNDLWMGDGVKVMGYASIGDARGVARGANAPHFSVFGGYFNNNEPDRQRHNNRLIFYSGHWGRIIAGDRNNRLNEATGNVSGSPRRPLRTYIRIETANVDNPNHYTYDVALLVGGQSDGSCYALDTIDIMQPSSIGRVIGGNIGYGRPAHVSKGGRTMPRPSDSFYGQIIINMTGGTLDELYGTSLGRHGQLLHPDDNDVVDSCATYFYGRSFIEITGGTVNRSIYGAGAGGVTGIGGDTYHTYDPYIPYTLTNGSIEYGTYDKAKGKLPHVIVSGDEVVRLHQTETHMDIRGDAKIRSTIYGGGYGYSDQLHTRNAVSQSGSIFGDTYVNIGGECVIDGYVFGGGRGTNIYYDNLDGLGYPTRNGQTMSAAMLSRLGNVYGRSTVNISGGTVRGCIYGAGEGSYYRPTSNNDKRNAVDDMASVFGSANVYMTGGLARDFIFGGGNYGNVRRSGLLNKYEDGSTHVYIEGGQMENSVFGGGHGFYDELNPDGSVSADIEGDAWVFLRGGEFHYTDAPSSYDTIRYYGVYGGGRTESKVHGSAHVLAERSLFSADFLKKTGLDHWEFGKLWDRRYSLCGGGFGQHTDVMGDTYVSIHFKDAPPFDRAMFFDKGKTRGDLTTVPHLSFIDVLGGGLEGNVHGSSHVTFRGRGYVRNLYGGGLMGSVGLRDEQLNGNLNEPSSDERAYTTKATVNFQSGSAYNIYGGSFMGDVCGETVVNIGSAKDSVANRDCHIYCLYGGNDITGTIAGSNNDNYGTNINIYGGTIHGDVYGSGNGEFGEYDKPNPKYPAGSLRNLVVGRNRPHVASASIRLAGRSETDRVQVLGAVYGGGNNTTVGIFTIDTTQEKTWGMSKEVMVPNRGRIRLNIGSHVRIQELFMGSNGRALNDFIPYFTEDDGKHWYKGFLTEDDFINYCRSVDVACMPTLTFNHSNSFSNKYPIIDWMGDRKVFETPGEMDAYDIWIYNFFGGSYRGSMTSDSLVVYTLPPGLTIGNRIVGGCSNSYVRYNEKHGPAAGTTRLRVGGFVPYHEDTKEYHRLQLNIFCNFDPVRRIDRKGGVAVFDGCKVFGGCYDHGIVNGATSINFHSNLVGDFDLVESGAELFRAANYLNTDCAQIYGGGKGVETEIIGSTYVTMSGALFNGIKCMPNLFNAFGGSMMGRIVGRTNVTFDGECQGASPFDATRYLLWGKMYGGGRMGDVVRQSRELPHLKSPTTVESRVYVHSGMVNQVFGGARLGNIEGGTYVEINDRSHNHFHTIVRRVYGGCDISGKVGMGKHKPDEARTNANANTFVRIMETMHDDSTYTGFPFVGEVFGGGNGNYGYGGYDRYNGGYIHTRRGDSIALAGMERPNIDSTYVEVLGGTIWDLYGGASNSLVKRSSVISVRYRKNADTRAHFDRMASQDCYRRGKWIITQFSSIRDGYTDDGSIIETENNIRRVFGGNNKMDMVIQPKWRLRSGNIGTIYGGCNVGDVVYYNEYADRNVHSDAESVVYQGGRETFSSPGIVLDLPWPDLTAGNVYGGSRMGNVIACRPTYSDEGIVTSLTPVTFADNQYGVTVQISNGRFGRVFGGNDITGTIHNGTHMQISGGEVDEIFGAGNGEYQYEYDPTVEQVTEDWDNDQKVWYYKVPALKEYGGANATDFQKILAINSYRPNIAKSFIEIAGGIRRDMTRRMAYVHGSVYCGGNCATILGPDKTEGFVRLDIGGQLVANNVYLGSNGLHHIEPTYVRRLMARNGIRNLAQADTDGRTLLDYHMEAVEMHGLPRDFQLHRNYTECYIGSFYVGGNRGSISTHGRIQIDFPSSMTIFNKIVGGSDRAEIVYRDPTSGETLIHHGGVLWDGTNERPDIRMNVNARFRDRVMTTDRAAQRQNFLIKRSDNAVEGSVPVYSGCYKSGKVEGIVTADISDPDDEETTDNIFDDDSDQRSGTFVFEPID